MDDIRKHEDNFNSYFSISGKKDDENNRKKLNLKSSLLRLVKF